MDYEITFLFPSWKLGDTILNQRVRIVFDHKALIVELQVLGRVTEMTLVRCIETLVTDMRRYTLYMCIKTVSVTKRPAGLFIQHLFSRTRDTDS